MKYIFNYYLGATVLPLSHVTSRHWCSAYVTFIPEDLYSSKILLQFQTRLGLQRGVLNVFLRLVTLRILFARQREKLCRETMLSRFGV